MGHTFSDLNQLSPHISLLFNHRHLPLYGVYIDLLVSLLQVEINSLRLSTHTDIRLSLNYHWQVHGPMRSSSLPPSGISLTLFHHRDEDIGCRPFWGVSLPSVETWRVGIPPVRVAMPCSASIFTRYSPLWSRSMLGSHILLWAFISPDHTDPRGHLHFFRAITERHSTPPSLPLLLPVVCRGSWSPAPEQLGVRDLGAPFLGHLVLP